MDHKDEISQNRTVHLPSVKLPKISPALANNNNMDEHLVPGRRSFMRNQWIMSHSPTVLKLPQLRLSSRKESVITGGTRESCSPELVTLPSLKLTKHEQLNQEAASNNTTNKKVGRLNMDIDKKLSTVHQSIQNFEKGYRLNQCIQNAVRRSLSGAAAARNKKDTSTGFIDTHQHKCDGVGLSRPETEEAADEIVTVTFTDSMTQNFGNDDFRQLNSMNMVSTGEIRESCADDHENLRHSTSSSHSAGVTQPKKFYDSDRTSSSPIMENLSDKAFLTKLKIKDCQASRNIQKMQNRANAVQNQLHMDKRKAKLEGSSRKPLYKPQKQHLLNTAESRPELMGFLQSNGGRTGSWNSADHAKFLKIYNTWKSVPELIIEKAMEELRHKNAQEVLAHAEWYAEFASLIESNKNEVRKWDEGKRREREILYKMAAEDRKTKSEDEKRRKEHLKSIQIKERQRARVNAAQWKNLKTKLDSTNLIETTDIDKGLCGAMLTLAKNVQSMAHPFPNTGRKPKPPSLRYASAKPFSNKNKAISGVKSNNDSKVKVHGDDVTLPTVQRIKLPPLNDKNETDETESDCSVQKQNVGCGDFENSKISNVVPLSTLQEDTFSHQIRKQAQILKRMEIRSLKGRVPHRFDEIQLQTLPTSLHLLSTRKTIPSWRKIS